MLFFALLTLSRFSHALTFREDAKTGILYASGAIELDDAERLSAIINDEYKQRHDTIRTGATVRLDSPGGNLLGGMRLGYALRKLWVHTEVADDASCLSACAVAFLGGQARTVMGRYGVHSASFKANYSTSTEGERLDAVQQLGAILMAYARDMTGSSEVMGRALATSSGSMSVLTDGELVGMRVITIARRPSQHGRTGFKCPSKMEFTVLGAVCSHNDIALIDVELNELFRKIQQERPSESLNREQARWRRYRNSCVNANEPNGYLNIVHCVRDAYIIRRDQLLSVWLDLSVRKTEPVASSWAEIAAHN